MTKPINVSFLVIGMILFFTNLSAQSYLKQGSAIKKQADSLYLLADYAGAEKMYLSELKHYQQYKDLHRTVLAKTNVVVVQLKLIRYAVGLDLLKKGLAELPKTPATDSSRFRIYNYLGLFYKRMNRFDSCQIFYEKALQLLENNKNIKANGTVFSFYINQGIWEMEKNDFKLSELYFLNALSITVKDKSLYSSAFFENLAYLYMLQKKYDVALNYFKKAINAAPSANKLPYILTNRGLCEVKIRQYQRAKKTLDSSYLAYRRYTTENKIEEDAYFLSIYYGNLAQYYLAIKQNDKAAYFLQKNIALNQTTSPSIDLSEAYLNLGNINKNLPLKALQYYQKALITTHFKFLEVDIYKNPSLENVFSERELFKALVGKADMFKLIYDKNNSLSDLKFSLETYQLAIKLAEKMRRSYASANAKAFFTENYFEVYEKAIEVAYTVYNATKNADYQNIIFEIQEKSKAAILTDISREAVIKPQTIDVNLLQEERVLNQQIAGLQVLLKNQTDSAKIIKLNAELVDNQLKINRLIERFEKESPNYFRLKYDFNAIKIKQIQQSLTNETAFVSYFINEKSLYVFLITNSLSSIYQQKIDSSFVIKLQHFRNLLANSPQGKKYNAQALSAELYNILIKPIEKEIEGKKRLIIIRDAELNYLPFEVLAKQKDDFMLKKYIISYAYSASLLTSPPAPLQSERRGGKGVLGFAPFSNNSFQQSLFRDKNLGQLPKSGNEVEKIGGDFYLENEATKKRFYEKYRDKNIIHFATHAITDDNDPLKSFIAFYPDSLDYKLFTNELYDLDLRNTSLVMLSACETGAGKLQKGEGVMSLSRAFTYAGAKAVITTLWNAHDEASAYISERFYKHLKDGFKTDEALQKAKLDFLNSDLALRYEHPYYWANFILIGPTETIDFGTNWWIWGIGIVLAILIVVIFYRRMVTKK